MRPDIDQSGESGELFDSLPLPENFDAVATKTAMARAVESPRARVVMPNRDQIELRPMDLESLLPQGHHARLVWAWVERQDLSAMYAAINVRQGGVGRSAIAPEILLALWLYATLQGVGSARQLSRLVLEHDAYRWISGGVQVNHHSLSDFRVAHGAALDELLSTSLAALMDAGVVTLKRVAQDGVRVRADAGAASFRRKGSLQDNLERARERVRDLKAELDADPARDSRRKAAAQQRARREMEQRLQQALNRMPELEAIKRRNGDKAEDARASSTDADASVMKMADGGFRPAYNTQFASDCDTLVIVGVDVSTSGSDMAQLAPMVQQIEQRLGQLPAHWLVDGGFPAHDQIDAVAGKTELYAPVPESRPTKDKQGNVVVLDKHQPKPGDSAAVVQWRERMASDEAKEIYKLRAATAECVNAQARNRGLQRMPVRGRAKARCVALMFALAHNLMRTLTLVPALLGLGTTASAFSAAVA
jgi:transposase